MGSEQIRPSDVCAGGCSWRSSCSRTGDGCGATSAKPNELVDQRLAVVLARCWSAFVAYRNERVFAAVYDVTRELEKVTWPTRKETSAATVVVMVTVLDRGRSF